MGQKAAKDNRNQRMDLYRGIAVYGVILIHVLFPGSFGSGVRALARFAVPFFFLTAGYFSLNATPRTLGRRAIRTLIQLLWVCLPYLLLSFWLASKNGLGIWRWLVGLFTWDNLVGLLAYHTIPLYYAWQLWFLGALFTVYLWWWMITELSGVRKGGLPYDLFAGIALGLLAFHLILGEGVALAGQSLDNQVLRNALLDGLPFFTLGCWCAFRRQEIRRLRIPWHYLILVGLALSLIEAKLAGRQELYLGTLVVLAGLMGRCLRYRRAPKGRLSQALQYCGRELTLYIYAVHMLVLALIKELPMLAWLSRLEWLLPLVVAALSTLAALGLVQIKEKLYPKGRA